MAEPKNNKQLSELLQPLSGQRQKSETDAAVQACNDWLRMGAGRSLRELTHNYSQQVTRNKRFKPPTEDYENLRQWSSKFSWAERAAEYDANFEALKNEERQAVFNQALALDFGRVKELIELADLLKEQIYEQDEDGKFYNIWNPDVKSIGSGEFAERVDIERFNSALISEYRATLADIAKEVGGRVAKQEVTGANGGAIKVDATLRWEQLMQGTDDGSSNTDESDPFA
jgi:hypothetical protein